jgi:prefoldin subunit 5
MTRQERVKVLRDMDAVIERTERTCQEYELIQMEMMAALARAKAIHKQLLAKKAELARELDEAGM